jgi:hypothetical protein
MPIVTDASASNHIVVRATGKIVKEDFTGFVPEFERLVHERGHLRVLFDATEFTGWDANALWQEIKFDLKNLSKIDRLAVLGTKAWQRALEGAMKPFAHPRMRYFDAAEITAAHQWLIST